jgi:hypothetical protein
MMGEPEFLTKARFGIDNQWWEFYESFPAGQIEYYFK